MKLKLAHLGDLTGLYFNIPYYQRGYRWEVKQVLDLLDDLFEFQQSRPKEKQFYCLQPLAVCLNGRIEAEDNIVFDVIDGQQRLTTIFLLMGYLGMNSFCLRYERVVRKGGNPCLWENGSLAYEQLQELSVSDMKCNPDYFYMKRAMAGIQDWFEKKQKRYPGIKRLMEDVLQSPKYEKGDKAFYDTEEDKNDSLSDVRFIWYDASGGLAGSSIAIFKRLNYGKTPLMASELIKALLFQCDIYDVDLRAEMKQIAFRMSTEWDAMEKALQDDFMWSMLFPQKYDKASRIDVVLSFVANELKENLNFEVNVSDADKDYVYLIFNNYVEQECQKSRPYQDIVKDIWTKIQDTYAIFRSWFADRELYHLTGLYLTLMNQNVKDHLQTLRTLVGDFKRWSRQNYIVSLKKRIGALIRFDENKFDDQTEASIENVYYGRFSREIARILFVYNVDMTMRHGQDRAYFPFKFYQDMKPSLEHIHPQHLHDEDIDFATRCRWFKDKCSELRDEDLKNAELQASVERLQEVLYLSPDEEAAKKTDMAKKSFREKEELYNANEYEYSQLLKIIDRYFDELAGIINEKELHGISNLALVDNVTNIRLGNGLLNTKRTILQRLSEEYDRSKGKDGAYVFIGTWRVFTKAFTPEAAELRFWTKIDRRNYLNDLKMVYDEYTR